MSLEPDAYKFEDKIKKGRCQIRIKQTVVICLMN